MTVGRTEAERFLRLAQRDQRAFETLNRQCKEEDFPNAAFHAQQSVEKAIKAVLSLHQVSFSRIHDLVELAGRARDTGLKLPLPDDTLYRLTPYAVEFRYNDETMPLIQPDVAQHAVQTFIQWATHHLTGNL